MKYLSTSALARDREMDSAELFKIFNENGWIYKKDDQWQLTKEGRLAGGDTKYNPKFGEYVVWPSNIDINQELNSNDLLNATKIGEYYNISNRKVNIYLSDLGWINKKRDGWELTREGKKNGGKQLELKNGVPFVLWEESILSNKHLKRTIDIGEGNLLEEEEEKEGTTEEFMDFRKKYPPSKRTSDGHYVRSRAELLIDNFFYQNRITHAYEKKLNIDEHLYCDFYLPENDIYIEYWGMEENTQYLARKKEKLEIYAKYGFKLIELHDSDIDNIDEILETKLRKNGVGIRKP